MLIPVTQRRPTFLNIDNFETECNANNSELLSSYGNNNVNYVPVNHPALSVMNIIFYEH